MYNNILSNYVVKPVQTCVAACPLQVDYVLALKAVAVLDHCLCTLEIGELVKG